MQAGGGLSRLKSYIQSCQYLTQIPPHCQIQGPSSNIDKDVGIGTLGTSMTDWNLAKEERAEDGLRELVFFPSPTFYKIRRAGR